MMRLFCAVFLFLGICHNALTWEARDDYFDEERYDIYLADSRLDGSLQALEAVLSAEQKDQNRQLDSVFLGYISLSQYPDIETEIDTYMTQHYPKVWHEALASAGNIHNPKIIALQAPFKEAFLQAEVLQAIDRKLREYGFSISSVDYEKFGFHRTERGNITFSAMTNLNITPKE